MADIISKVALNVKVFTWDTATAMMNLVSPNLSPTKVVPEGHPGFGGKWPEYQAPKEGDSRCSCPALNAMANHGILPRDGKNVSFKEMTAKIRTTYNFAGSFCYFVPKFAANMLKKDYEKDTFNLSDLDLHNGIEHDASLTRQDVAIQPDQSKPYIPYIRQLLDAATGKDKDGDPCLTIADLSKVSSIRRAEARANNPNFSLDTFHKMFGSSNSSTMLLFWGGKVRDLEALLIEERLPEGWQPKVLSRFGLTMAAFNATVFRVEYGIDEKKLGKID
jgi:hypothetical protein